MAIADAKIAADGRGSHASTATYSEPAETATEDDQSSAGSKIVSKRRTVKPDGSASTWTASASSGASTPRSTGRPQRGSPRSMSVCTDAELPQLSSMTAPQF